MIPTLTTTRLKLRPFELRDAPDVQRLAGAKEVAATTLTIPHPYPDGAAEEWIGGHAANWEAKRNVTFAITEPSLGLVGTINLRLDIENRRGEMGYWIGVPYWNRGFATEAAHAIVKFGFQDLELNRIDAHYLASNRASGKVMEKLGMQREGVLRQHIIKWGVTQDVVLYGLLASEFDGTTRS